MNELMTNIKMTSLDISEIVGKKHTHIMRDIRKEIDELGPEINQSIFGLVTYKDKKGEERPCYIFSKDGAMQLALKYDAKTRYEVIKYVEKLESGNKPSYMIDDPVKRAETWIVEQKEKQKLETSNLMLEQRVGELKPKADYTTRILKNKGLVLISQIAHDYGMTANKLNKLLHELKVQYKRGGQWLLYTGYHDKGYTHSETFDFTRKDGTEDVSMTTKWTQRGRLFLYNLLKENEIVPVIEKELV